MAGVKADVVVGGVNYTDVRRIVKAQTTGCYVVNGRSISVCSSGRCASELDFVTN